VIIHDAAAAFTRLIDAAFLWVETLAFVLCVAVLCAAPLIAPTTPRSIRRRPATARRVPSWAHTEPYDYDEAA
jgi:hypothetical protein